MKVVYVLLNVILKKHLVDAYHKRGYEYSIAQRQYM